MPTILTHAVLPLAVAWGLGPMRISPKLAFAGAVAAMLPDADVIGFAMGVPYETAWGHRGATHSLALALIYGLVAAGLAGRLQSTPRTTFLFVGGAMASHGLTDMLTDGGHGIAIFWPFSDQRFFWPFRPIEVSPIGLTRFLGPRGLDVLMSELVWLVLPTLIMVLALRKFLPRPVDLAGPRS